MDTAIPNYNTAGGRDTSTTWNGVLHERRRQNSGDRSPKLIMEFQDDDSGFCKKKIRDPLSHRIIEKRRRDRMNTCLSDLSKLIPVSHLRTGHGRIEKTEIIEMAIKHLKRLQANADIAQLNERCNFPYPEQGPGYLHHFQNGYQECTSEMMRFLVEVEGYYAGDRLCIRLLNHLRQHCSKLMEDLRGNGMKKEPPSTIGEKETDPTICELSEEKPSYSLKSCLTFCTSSEKEVKPMLHVLECRKPTETLFKSFDSQTIAVGPNDGELKHEQPRGETCKLPTPQDSLSKSRPVSVASSSSSTRSDETYKYKNNMKDRFHADSLQQHPSTSESECDTVTIKPTMHFNGCQQKSQDFANLPELIDLKNYPIPSVDHHSGYKNFLRSDFMQNLLPNALSIGQLPMFVLHPNHNFYIPMTIASSIIDSVVTKFNSYLPLLHSVNILVYFGNAVNVPESAFRPI